MRRRASVVLALSALLSAPAFPTSAKAQTASAKVVLELFTSQGCSSCPPADALFESYKKRDDVIALTFPVDYWDRLGWKDTFAKPAYTARQYEYASARGERGVYTPQVVVSGMSHVVGSSRSGIDSAIASAKKALRESHVSLQARIDDEGLTVDVAAAETGPVSNAQLLLAVVQDFGKVSIRRGENANRDVTYYNIVLSLETISAWNGKPTSLRLAKIEYGRESGQSLAVLLQIGIGGPIVGATQIRIPGQKNGPVR